MFLKLKEINKRIDNKYLKNSLKIFWNKIHKTDIRKFKSNSFATIKIQKYKKLDYWNNFFTHIVNNKLEGDIIECGVGNGFTLSLILYNLIKNKNKFIDKKKYIGFDSFEGFPEASQYDFSPRNLQKGDSNFISIEFVKQNLKRIGFSEIEIEENVIFKKGFFEKTFNDFHCDKISLLHLDCDLYESYKISLNKYYPKVVKNGIIVFDEYIDDKVKWPGAAKAIDEFFKNNSKEIVQDDLTKKFYYIKT